MGAVRSVRALSARERASCSALSRAIDLFIAVATLSTNSSRQGRAQGRGGSQLAVPVAEVAERMARAVHYRDRLSPFEQTGLGRELQEVSGSHWEASRACVARGGMGSAQCLTGRWLLQLGAPRSSATHRALPASGASLNRRECCLPAVHTLFI